MMTVDESLEWSEETEEFLFDMPDETCEAFKVLAAEVRRLREALESTLAENTVLIRALERIATHNGYGAPCQSIASKALQRAGGK